MCYPVISVSLILLDRWTNLEDYSTIGPRVSVSTGRAVGLVKAEIFPLKPGLKTKDEDRERFLRNQYMDTTQPQHRVQRRCVCR